VSSAQERLERLLYVLPRAARPEGGHIGELARALDVAPAEILADIEEATTRVFYHPGGMTDAFNFTVEGDVVRLHGREFNRPARLTVAEAMALGLGLRVLAAEADVERRNELLALAHQLEAELVTPEILMQPMLRDRDAIREEVGYATVSAPSEVEVALGEDDFRGDIAAAVQTRVFCDVVYLKAGGSSPAELRMAPVRLIYARGHWYVRAFEDESKAIRNYRLDRILELSLTDEHHDYADVSTAAPGFASDGGLPVQVRYSTEVARWVAERENAQCEPDGTLVMTYDVVDMNWLVRHVLQYGGEAVVETPEARAAVAKAVEDIA
jgi:predicted DNA-binding transcriptional regulator YafY